jgi:uncharacterized protein with FMN-binding domain
VRTATKSAIGILSLGVIAASYTAGTAAQIGFGASTVSASTTATEATPTADPNVAVPAPGVANASEVETELEDQSANDDVTSVPVQTKTAATPTPSATKNSAAATSSAATPTATATPTPTKTAGTSTTSVAKTGSAINYKYGVIQLEVVKSGSKITSINLIQASTKGRDWAVVPSMLVTTAIAAQGSNFGNMSGATFSTQAFKSALESALAKF